MRLIRFAIISLILLFIVFFVVSLAIPSHIRISRAIDIIATKKKVFNDINDLKVWDKWNQFTTNSALTNKTFSEPSSGNSAFMKADQINIVITESTLDSVKTKWDQTNAKHFEGGFNIMELRTGTITVQYYFDFHFFNFL